MQVERSKHTMLKSSLIWEDLAGQVVVKGMSEEDLLKVGLCFKKGSNFAIMADDINKNVTPPFETEQQLAQVEKVLKKHLQPIE